MEKISFNIPSTNNLDIVKSTTFSSNSANSSSVCNDCGSFKDTILAESKALLATEFSDNKDSKSLDIPTSTPEINDFK